MSIISETSEYKILRYKDSYTIENKTNNPLEISIREMECNSPTYYNSKFTLNAETLKDLKFKYDATYGIYVADNDIPSSVISIFDNTKSYIVSFTEEILCGCNCAGCDDCDDKTECNLSLQTLSLMFAFYITTNPIYQKYFNIVSSHLKCDITADLLCQINNLTTKGKSDYKFFIKKLIATFYLVFYLQDVIQAEDKEEAEFIKKKYNYKIIKPCIKKLGINPDDIIEEILSGMKVKYWQFTSTVPTIQTVIGLWTPTYLDTLTGIDERPIEDFEQGVTIPYINIGRIGFAISPTQLLNFTILDSLGNDITDNFDTHYFPGEETAVFVSKVPYSHSNIYFKFKKNIYA